MNADNRDEYVKVLDSCATIVDGVARMVEIEGATEAETALAAAATGPIAQTYARDRRRLLDLSALLAIAAGAIRDATPVPDFLACTRLVALPFARPTDRHRVDAIALSEAVDRVLVPDGGEE